MATYIIGAVFFLAVGVAGYKSYKSMRSNSCPGCSGNCSAQTKAQCASSKGSSHH